MIELRTRTLADCGFLDFVVEQKQRFLWVFPYWETIAKFSDWPENFKRSQGRAREFIEHYKKAHLTQPEYFSANPLTSHGARINCLLQDVLADFPTGHISITRLSDGRYSLTTHDGVGGGPGNKEHYLGHNIHEAVLDYFEQKNSEAGDE